MTYVLVGLGVVALLIMVALVVMRQQSDDAPRQSLPSAGANVRQSAASKRVSRESNWLEGLEGVAATKTFHIGMRSITAGRKIGNYIQLMDDGISRVHFKVSGTASGAQVEDMGSDNGTFVNDQQLVSKVPQPLSDGDLIRVGGNVFKYHARAEFQVDHGLTDKKVASQAQHRQTAAMGIVNWKDEIVEALDKAGGDPAKAAEIMGVSEEVFQKMLQSTRE